MTISKVSLSYVRKYRELLTSSPRGVITLESVQQGNNFVILDHEVVGPGREIGTLEGEIGRSFSDAFPELDESGMVDVIRKVWRTREAHTHDVKEEKTNGITFWGRNYVYTDHHGHVLIFYEDITEEKKVKIRNEHLNSVLDSIKNVNQLLGSKHDRYDLIDGVCRTLTDDRGYHNVWIALLDGSLELEGYAQSGLGHDFQPMYKLLKSGYLPATTRKALESDGVVSVHNPKFTCVDCPLAGEYTGRGALAARIEHGDRVYGVISASTPVQYVDNEEEKSLFAEVSGDIGFALHKIQAEEALKWHSESESMLRRLSSEFLSSKADEFDRAIDRGLAEISEFLEVDWGYVFTFDWESDTMSNAHEWCADGVEPQKNELQDLQNQVFSSWVKKMEGLEPLQITSVADLPESWSAEQEFLQRQGVKSLIVVPITNRGELLGYAGFGSVVERRDWSDDEISLLKVFGGLTGNALNRFQARQELQKSRRRYRKLAEEAPIGILTCDEDGGIEYVNERLLTILGSPGRQETMDIDLMDYPSLKRAGISDALKECLETQHEQRLEIEYETKWGKTLWLRVHITSQLVDDESAGCQLIVDDITEQKRAERALAQEREKFRKQAIRDPLTGLYNRRYLKEVMRKEAAEAERYGGPIAFLMMDINKFKQINDVHSHQTGDRVLRVVAEIVSNNVRDADYVIRYGGDEFLVMMPRTEGESRAIEGRLRKKLDLWNEESDFLDFELTVAMGSSVWRPNQGVDIERVIKRADTFMYEGKENFT